jgi:RNA polymerase sigma factor for flagellar operon FliA
MEPKRASRDLSTASRAFPTGSAGLKLITDGDRVVASLWYRWRKGGEKEARASLFGEYTRFARSVARSQFRTHPPYGLDIADFEQLAFEGLLQAIDRFNPDLGIPFQAFARRRITGSIRDGLAKSSDDAAAYTARRRTLTDRMASLRANPEGPGVEALLSSLSDLVIGLAIGIMADQAVAEIDAFVSKDYIATRYGGEAVRELQLAVVAESQKLDEPEFSVIRQHYFEGVPFVQLALSRGVSKGRISQIHRSALGKLKDRLRDKGD